MELEIGAKQYELRFGLSFINEIDTIYTQDIDGFQFGTGLEMMQTYLGLRRPTVLYNIIKAGTSHLNSKPSNNEIEKFLEDIFISGEQEGFFERVEEAAKQAPFLSQAMKRMQAEEQQ